MKKAIQLILFSPMLIMALVIAVVRYIWGITVTLSWEMGCQWSDNWLDKTESWTNNGITDPSEKMTPQEEAIKLVHDVYYYLVGSSDRQYRTKEVAKMFCNRHIEELKTLPETSETRLHIQFWTDTITEIKGL